MTHRHVPVVLRDEHHRHNNNCFATFFDECVSDFISPTLARLSCSRFHNISNRLLVVPTLWKIDHDSPGPLRMEERHSDVVSGNRTIVLSLRICFRCSLTHNVSGSLDWWCHLRHVLTDIRVYMCRNQSAPDRIRVLRRPFIQPLSADNLQALCSGFLKLDGSATSTSQCSQALSTDPRTLSVSQTEFHSWLRSTSCPSR